MYAQFVDKCSRDDTRVAACKDSYWAYLYAKYIDKCFHKYVPIMSEASIDGRTSARPDSRLGNISAVVHLPNGHDLPSLQAAKCGLRPVQPLY